MSGSVTFFILSALLAGGSALVCETCTSNNSTTCSGPLKTCDPSEDFCLSTTAQYRFAAFLITRTNKECSSSEYQTCRDIPFTMTFRPSITMRMGFHCCKNDSCNTEPVELLPFAEELNGLECPSCFALGSSRCLNVDILKCRGNEDHCYEISGTTMAGNLNFTKTAAGCASAGICRNKKTGITAFNKNIVDYLTKFVCYAAPKVAEIKTEI